MLLNMSQTWFKVLLNSIEVYLHCSFGEGKS